VRGVNDAPNPPAAEPPSTAPRPLDGVRVLELAQLVAAPTAAALLGYFGADVVKVEEPGAGDPLRTWRVTDDAGTSFWWRSLARNKRCITLDLRRAEGRDVARRLAARADVLVESFRPGTLERWGLGPDVLLADNPRLVVARVSGFGQTGPYAHRPGYASIAEAYGGLRHLTGFPGEPPVRANLSLGDSLAGLHAAFGVLLALRARDATGRGQVVDVALTESVFAMLESVIPDFAGAGVVRGPSGTTITGVAPSDAYPTRDGRHVVIGANGESVFRRLMHAIGRADLAADPGLAGNAARVAAQREIDAAITDFTSARDVDAVLAALEAAEVPVGPIHDAAAMLHDPQFVARGLFERAESDGIAYTLPAMFPRLTETPGVTRFAGPAHGAHTREVLREAGLDDAAIDALAQAGVIAR
jgi:crotonobetainyl-CoA:carnitine CoA-transferase CaiB-like acyl-CoA transferase